MWTRLDEPVTDPATLWALEALEHVGTAAVRPIFAAMAGGAPNSPLTRDARAARDRLDR